MIIFLHYKSSAINKIAKIFLFLGTNDIIYNTLFNVISTRPGFFGVHFTQINGDLFHNIDIFKNTAKIITKICLY